MPLKNEKLSLISKKNVKISRRSKFVFIVKFIIIKNTYITTRCFLFTGNTDTFIGNILLPYYLHIIGWELYFQVNLPQHTTWMKSVEFCASCSVMLFVSLSSPCNTVTRKPNSFSCGRQMVERLDSGIAAISESSRSGTRRWRWYSVQYVAVFSSPTITLSHSNTGCVSLEHTNESQ
jgi:hypothetical protein